MDDVPVPVTQAAQSSQAEHEVESSTGPQVGAFLFLVVLFGGLGTASYFLTKLGGFFSLMGWIGVVFFGFATLGSFGFLSADTPQPQPSAIACDTAQLAELQRALDSNEMNDRVTQTEALADLVGVCAIRMGDDKGMQDAFRAGFATTGGAVPYVPSNYLTRMMVAQIMLSEAASQRSLELADAAFAHILCVDLVQLLTGDRIDTSNPAWAWVSLIKRDGFFGNLDARLVELEEMLDEAHAYNLAANDRNSTDRARRIATSLAGKFRRPWPSTQY